MLTVVAFALLLAVPEVNKAPLPIVKAVSFGLAEGGPHFTVGTVGGQEAVGWIELSAPATCAFNCDKTYVNGKSAGGMNVSVSSSNPTLAKVQAPGIVFFPTGETRKSFSVLTSGVSAATTVTISAWREGSPAQSAPLHIVPLSLVGFAVDQTTLMSGSAAHGTLTFNGTSASAGAVVVKLSSNNPAVQVPASIALDAGKTVATFDVKAIGVAQTAHATVTASYGDHQPTASVTVNPGVLTKFSRNDGIELSGAAPPSGAVIAISNSDPSHVSVPANITIAGGATKSALPISGTCDFSSHKATISGAYNGVTKSFDYSVDAMHRPDLAIKEVTLRDRFGNTITSPQDSQAYKMCVTVELRGVDAYPYAYPPGTSLHFAYLTPTGTGTSAGHEFDVPVPFPYAVGSCGSWTATGPGAIRSDATSANPVPRVYWFDPPTCIDMPGLAQPGAYTDVSVAVDPNNKIVEANEGNNTHKQRITRQ